MPKEVYVNKVDKEIFKSIYIDEVYIHIGTYRLKQNNAGIYNQICDYFDSKRKLPHFIKWLTTEYAASSILAEEEIAKWENKLVLTAKSSIYTEMLRIERNPDLSYTFYATKNKGLELRYLCSMKSQHYFKIISNFLKYDPLSTKICHEKSLDHPMDKTNKELSKDIDICIRYNLIPIIDIVYTISNTKDKYCIGYYNLNTGDSNNPTPGWDSFMATIVEERAKGCFKAWVYSVFKDDNFGRQIMWLHGGGETGKSKVIKALKIKMEQINPTLVSTFSPTEFQDKYTSSAHIKKRLIISQDITDRKLLRNWLVKNITGNDDITIRGMGKTEDKANVYGKLIVSSNKIPWVNPTLNEEISRLLLISVNPEMAFVQKTQWDVKTQGEWSDALIKEMDDFIASCKNSYDEFLNEDGHNIAHYPEMMQKVNSTSFVAANLLVWWQYCIQPYEPTKKKKTNTLYVDELIEDFKRFMGKRGQNPRYEYAIVATMTPFLLEHAGTIYELNDIAHSFYITGYEFQMPAAIMRDKITDVLDERADLINKEGGNTGQIFATRKDNQKRGWKTGNNASPERLSDKTN